MAKASTTEDWCDLYQATTLQLLRQPPGLPPERQADLLATIQERLIPELIVAHWEGEPNLPDPCPDVRVPPTEEEIFAFARIAVDQDLPGALAFVESLAAQGISVEVILLHLIAPAARLLGQEWADDTTSWSDVTIGLGTLQQVVHVFGPSSTPEVADRGRVVLASAPREQHTLGIYLLGELLRRAGWGVQVEANVADADLIALVGSVRVEVMGLSVSNIELVPPLGRLIAALKKASLNPRLAVMLGGSLDLSAEAEQFGATFCTDPQQVVRWLEEHSNTADKRRKLRFTAAPEE